MTDASSFTKFVPGFDFLQGLFKDAGSALPGMGQWVAPTLDPKELEKRIGELRTVQYWLEQNARMLGATIQALEVQRMTLSTLKTMNVQMEDLRDSLKIRMPGVDPDSAPVDEAAASATQPVPRAGAAPAAAPVDPTQWWGALTQQFAQLAATAIKDNAADVARNLATSMVKSGVDAAGQTLKAAAAVPAGVARKVGGAAAKGVARAKRAAPRA